MARSKPRGGDGKKSADHWGPDVILARQALKTERLQRKRKKKEQAREAARQKKPRVDPADDDHAGALSRAREVLEHRTAKKPQHPPPAAGDASGSDSDSDSESAPDAEDEQTLFERAAAKKRRANGNKAVRVLSATALAATGSASLRDARALYARETEHSRGRRKTLLELERAERRAASHKARLERWDDVTERKRERAAREEWERRQAEAGHREGTAARFRMGVKSTRRIHRKGPETWQLKGAARPAHEVYDFDVRYVCPHQEEMKDYQARTEREINVFLKYRGQFALDAGAATWDTAAYPPQPVCKEYLAVLMEIGNLRREIGRDGAAARAFAECAELDGDGAGHNDTDARDRAVRTYTLLKKYRSASQLCRGVPPTTWTAYAVALLPHLGGGKADNDDAVRAAVRAHPLVAHRILADAAFKAAEGGAVAEAAEEIDGAPPGTAAEALEYGASEQMDLWAGCARARACLRRVLQVAAATGGGAGEEEGSTAASVDWAACLDAEERAIREAQNGGSDDEEREGDAAKEGGQDNGAEDGGDGGDEDEPEVLEGDAELAYIAMFRVAMEEHLRHEKGGAGSQHEATLVEE